jgi:N-acylneuraminate cytidylyltransferase
LEYKWPENVRKRSQDLETYYHDAGQFYFWKVKGFAEGIGVNVVPFILPEQEVQDIDNLSDWEIAEIKYRLMIQK